jgi:hypothetical protein
MAITGGDAEKYKCYQKHEIVLVFGRHHQNFKMLIILDQQFQLRLFPLKSANP